MLLAVGVRLEASSDFSIQEHDDQKVDAVLRSRLRHCFRYERRPPNSATPDPGPRRPPRRSRGRCDERNQWIGQNAVISNRGTGSGRDIARPVNADSDVAQLRSLEAAADLALSVDENDKNSFEIQAISRAVLDADAADLKEQTRRGCETGGPG